MFQLPLQEHSYKVLSGIQRTNEDVQVMRPGTEPDQEPQVLMNLHFPDVVSAMRFSELFTGYHTLFPGDNAANVKFDIPAGGVFAPVTPRVFWGPVRSRLDVFLREYMKESEKRQVPYVSPVFSRAIALMDAAQTADILDLSGCKLDDQQAAAVFAALMTALSFQPQVTGRFDDNLELTGLNLSDNVISFAGVGELMPILRTSPSLTSVNLTKNFIDNMAAVALAAGLSVCALASIDLSNNDIGNKGVIAILEACKTNEKLTQLNLAHNRVGDTGAQKIGEILKENQTITSIDVSHNRIESGGVLALLEGLADNKTYVFQ